MSNQQPASDRTTANEAAELEYNSWSCEPLFEIGSDSARKAYAADVVNHRDYQEELAELLNCHAILPDLFKVLQFAPLEAQQFLARIQEIYSAHVADKIIEEDGPDYQPWLDCDMNFQDSLIKLEEFKKEFLK